MKYEVIDNFLDEEYFKSLVTLFTDKEETGPVLIPWYLNTNIAHGNGHKNYIAKKDKLFYMAHMLYIDHKPRSPYFDNLFLLLDKLNVNCLLRIKANLYPNTHILQEHPMHEDYDFSHSSAILSLNTCDGYTKLEDGTKIDSIANRVLLFDSSKKHCSTTTTNVPARINININYIQEQFNEMK